ncbi:hypothetical protein ACFX16_042264 [Malus domestica]
MRLGTWNIRTLTGKSMEVVEVMVRRRINIMCLQETKWVGRKGKDLENSGFKLWYSGTNRTRNGVGIIVDKTLTQDVVDVKRVGDRIMAIKIVIGQELINVISAYAPQVGLDTLGRPWRLGARNCSDGEVIYRRRFKWTRGQGDRQLWRFSWWPWFWGEKRGWGSYLGFCNGI